MNRRKKKFFSCRFYVIDWKCAASIELNPINNCIEAFNFTTKANAQWAYASTDIETYKPYKRSTTISSKLADARARLYKQQKTEADRPRAASSQHVHISFLLTIFCRFAYENHGLCKISSVCTKSNSYSSKYSVLSI